MFILDPRVRRNGGRGEGGKDDGWGCVVGGGFFRGWGRLSFLKSGIHALWIPAFAGMTEGGKQE